ncbi:hypothetical protein BDV96DRAFT_567901 [Lophiotrema nucula]|uniref:Uncharacterized protein n=1 Tax=Lophiotrema nucula TaxID=690887 RepID=A0A6A5ZL73_9PLEO|nr:hypothetical protein BDV96DRAFT_567901 [Lophiotrema nucula]
MGRLLHASSSCTRGAGTACRCSQGQLPGDKLSFGEKIAASTIGGALSFWNQPFEV